ncbi:PolA DNA polymerase I - 3'-5' exonuclease and polymerase domains [Candidatus Nanopelagicaceae bacterium]
MSAPKKLLLIDGHSMAYRAFYALPVENFTTAMGQHTNAIYGFATMLISLIKEEKPTHVAVAFDVSRKTFRSDIFPEYKANRASTPDEFRSQMSYLHEFIDGCGIEHFQLEGYEADDLIATISKKAEKDGFEILICTGDRDSFQLVNEKTTVLYPKRGVSEMARMTPDAVIEKYGMTPAQYPDFAALRGDPSDNLPSIPGVGEKTAAKWVVEYGSLKELLSEVDKVGGKVGQSLRDNIDNVIRNRELTQLVHDAPITFALDAMEWKGIDLEKIDPLLTTLEFKTLKDRFKPIAAAGTAPAKGKKSATSELQGDLFGAPVKADFISAAELSKKIGAHGGEIAVAFTLSGDSVDEQLVRYAVALNATDVFLVEGSTMGEWATDTSCPKIVYDGKSLARINGFSGFTFDIDLAAYLVNPGVRASSIADVADKWGHPLDSSSAENLLASQAVSFFELKKNLEADLTERGLNDLFTKLELPIAELLAVMENRGVAVDIRELNRLLELFESEVAEETAKAHKSVGHEFNVASPKQLQVVLFEELGLPKTKKIKTGFTTDADSLNWLFEKTAHPVLASLLRIREVKKLATTIDGLVAEVAGDKRIHTHFAQTVAATGRLSSVGPNLQNIPVRTEDGRKIRATFIAGKGYDALLTADYSQIEMRIMAHLSHDANLIKAFESGEDLHASIAGEVFGVKPGDVDPEMRRQIKAMSYGLAYGLSSYGLAAQLDLSPPAAQDLMDRYFERFGGIRDYLKTVVEEARKVGYTETVMGRRRYLPDLMSDNRQRREVAERMALNAPIQGSAADIIKLAMLNVQKALVEGGFTSRLLLQVHDELILEIIAKEEVAVTELVRREMGSAFPLKAPLNVGIGVGKNWNIAAH